MLCCATTRFLCPQVIAGLSHDAYKELLEAAKVLWSSLCFLKYGCEGGFLAFGHKKNPEHALLYWESVRRV